MHPAGDRSGMSNINERSTTKWDRKTQKEESIGREINTGKTLVQYVLIVKWMWGMEVKTAGGW